MSTYYLPPGTSRVFANQTTGDNFLLTGRNTLFLLSDSGSHIGLLGSGNLVDISSTTGTQISDFGRGSDIDFFTGSIGNSIIADFQYDPTGIVYSSTKGPTPFNLTNGTTGTPLPSDGHGGSILTISATNGGASRSLDFRGDPHVVINGTIPPGANV